MNQPLAYVHPGAKIARNVVIDPFLSRNYAIVIDFIPLTAFRYSSCSLAANLGFESDDVAPYVWRIRWIAEDFDFDRIQKLVLDLDY